MLKTIPVENFQLCYQKWKQRLHGVYLPKGTILKGITLMFEENKNFGK